MNILLSLEEQIYRTQAQLERFVLTYQIAMEITTDMCMQFAVAIYEDQLSRTMHWCPDSDYSGVFLNKLFPWYYEESTRDHSAPELSAFAAMFDTLHVVRDDCEIMLLDALPETFQLAPTWNLMMVRALPNFSLLLISAGDIRVIEWEAQARNNPNLSAKTKTALREQALTDVATVDRIEAAIVDLSSPFNASPGDPTMYNVADFRSLVYQGLRFNDHHISQLHRPDGVTITPLSDV